jgi:dephospho-CoA kinase
VRCLIGLTGSIGMGKSSTAKLFSDAGCDVWDADQAVHRLYAKDGAATSLIGDLFPSALGPDGVDRAELRNIIASTPDALKKIEQIVHPLVAQDREQFKTESNKDILVFDIPLLFETSGEAHMDVTICVHIDPATQRERVLDRGTMSEQQFEQILAKQMPIADKLARADYTLFTDTPEHALSQVQDILSDIRKKMADA